MEPSAKIFSGTGSQYLAEKIAKKFGEPLGKVNIQRFSDGEIYVEFQESIRGQFVFLIQSTYSPTDNLMELLLMIDAAKRASAYKVIAVIPYYGFARQDRKDRPRVAIGAKLVANMITAAGADRVITMDLHAPQIQGYFDIPVDHLEASAIFIPYIEKLNLPNLTFAAPDVGSANRISLSRFRPPVSRCLRPLPCSARNTRAQSPTLPASPSLRLRVSLSPRLPFSPSSASCPPSRSSAPASPASAALTFSATTSTSRFSSAMPTSAAIRTPSPSTSPQSPM